MLFRCIHRERDLPGQTARSDVVEGEQENRARDKHAGVKHRRENENERRKPDQILGADTGSEHEEHEPRASKRFNKCAVAGVAMLPRDPESSADNDYFENRDDDILSRLKIKKRKPTEIGQTRQAKQISYPPDSPIASVGEHVFGKQAGKIDERLQPQKTGRDRSGNQKTAASILG